MGRTARERDIARARERADLARLRFGNNVQGLVHRMSLERLKADALELASDQFEHARRDLAQRLRYWPIAGAALGAGVAALILWRPARAAARFGMKHGIRLVSLALATRRLWKGVQ